MKRKSLAGLILGLLVTPFLILALGGGAPDTLRTVHGFAANGAPYTAVFRDRHPSPFVAWAQVQNARGQNASLIYESQALGVATTATAGAVGAAASDVITWAIPFADTNYQVACTPDGVATAIPVQGWLTKTATAVTVNHVATTAAAASNAAPGVDCVAIHP